MLAASAKSTLDVIQEGSVTFATPEIIALAIGCFVSFIVALFAVKSFIEIVQKFGFRFFGVYRIIVGSIILFLLIFKP